MNTQLTRLNVPNMTCGSCGHHIRSALAQLEGIEGVEVRLSTRQVSVRHRPDEAPLSDLLAAIRSAGYDASQVGEGSA